MLSGVRRNCRRVFAFLLTVAMVATNLSANLSVAFAAGETERALFLLEGEELRAAIAAGKEEGKVFSFSSLELKAGRKSIRDKYEKLLGGKEGKVYELDVEVDDSYAPEGASLEVYYNEAANDVVFLFVNESDMVVTFSVNIDGYETTAVTVSPNTEHVEDEDASYAEDYQSGTMVDDVKGKPAAEVVGPQETEAKGLEKDSADEADGEGDKEETDAGEDAVEVPEESKEEGVSPIEPEDETIAEETVQEEEATEAEETEAKTEEISSEADETEEETGAFEEEEAPAEEAEAEDEELLSISRHQAAVVAVSVDSLDDGQEPVNEAQEAEEESEAGTEDIEPKEEEAGEPEEEGNTAEAEPEQDPEKAEETEAAETGTADLGEATESETKETEAADPSGESETEETEALDPSGEGETEETEAVDPTEESKDEEGNQAGQAEEGETEPSEAGSQDQTEKVPDVVEETEGDAGKETAEDPKEGALEDTEPGNKGETPDMEGQLLENDSVEILGELKGKDFKAVTIRDHANARAFQVAWEDIEEIILESEPAAEDGEFLVDYQVNFPEAASVKGAGSVAEGEDLCFAVEEEAGFEVVAVYANGEELEPVEDTKDLASASNWKGYSYVYILEGVTEDILVEVEANELEEAMVIPAATYTAEAEDAIFTVNVPEDAFEEEVEFRAEKITEESKIREMASQADEALGENQAVAEIYAYDLAFLTAGQEEVEPSKPVGVSVSFKKEVVSEEIAEGASGISVVHFPEGKGAETVASVEHTDLAEVEFQADSFSEYAITITKAADVPREGWIAAGSPDELHDAFTKNGVQGKVYLTEDITTIYEEVTENGKKIIKADHGWAIPVGSDFTLDLNGHTLTYGGEGSVRKRLFYVRGVLTIMDSSSEGKGAITQEEETIDGLICVAGGTLNLEGGTITAGEGHSNNHGVLVGTDGIKNGKYVDSEPIGGTFNMKGGRIAGNGNANSDGGGIYVYKGTLNVSGGSIQENTANNGGGIYGCPDALIFVTGGSIQGNKSEKPEPKYKDDPAGYNAGSGGGGIFSRGKLVMSGGEICGNTANADGGGVYQDIDMNVYWNRDNYSFSMEGGTISQNIAGGEGGGIYFGWDGKVAGGSILNNEAHTEFDWGGGGIFIQTGVSVKMENVLVSGNHAEGFGGGVAGCPSGNVKIFTVNGAAIYGNEAAGTGLTKREDADKKTEDQEAAADPLFTKDGLYQDYYCQNESVVYGKMLGGGAANWKGSSKQKGQKTEEITIGKYESKRSNYRMGLSAAPDSLGKSYAENMASVRISGNTSATHGGGIMCNGYLELGTEENNKTTIEISGEKTWADDGNRDGMRPESIIVRLYADGTMTDYQEVTPDEGGKWNWTFTAPEKDDSGKKITYTIKEEIKNNPGYEPTVDGYNITNTYSPKKISVSGQKTWEDADNQDGKRPETIQVELYANGKATGNIKEVRADKEGNWSWTFEGLHQYEGGKEIDYTVKEVVVPKGYSATEEGANIINTYIPEVVEVKGEKIWEDADNQDGKRPDKIEVKLYADGVEIDSKAVTAADGWKWSFGNLPKYRNGGKKISYTFSEVKSEGYIPEEVDPDESNGYTGKITNTYNPEKTYRIVTKKWADNDNQDGKRPGQIKVQLTADGVNVGDPVILNEANKWKAQWKPLDVYKDGVPIQYDVVEVKDPEWEGFYTPQITFEEDKNTFAIVNTHEPLTVKKTVVKKWADNGNQGNTRPSEITVELQGNGVVRDKVALSEANGWKYTWDNLPQYENGKEITYKIIETSDIKGYSASTSISPEGDTTTITNTYTPDKPNNPTRPGGGTGGGGGGGPKGGNNPGGPGETTEIDEPEVPLANFNENDPELIPLVEEEVPLASFLPKTGDSRSVAMWMFMFGSAGIGLLATAIGLKKKRKEG